MLSPPDQFVVVAVLKSLAYQTFDRESLFSSERRMAKRKTARPVVRATFLGHVSAPVRYRALFRSCSNMIEDDAQARRIRAKYWYNGLLTSRKANYFSC